MLSPPPSIHLFLHSSLRKLLEQREEELQQQVRSLRLKEASLTWTNAELSHRTQQLDTRLSILEAELNKAREEVTNSVQQSIRYHWYCRVFPHLKRLLHSYYVCFTKIMIKCDSQLISIDTFSHFT